MEILVKSALSVPDDAPPLIVGVTGHRDVKNLARENVAGKAKAGLPKMREAIGDCLAYWRLVAGPDTPIWLLSGMAEGADLLAVDVALEKQREWGTDALQVFAVLPMALDAYEQDFSPQESDKEYGIPGLHRLLRQIPASQCLIPAHGLSEPDYHFACQDMNYGPLRNALYLNTGLFIARHCHVLVALWNGLEAKGMGGTTDIVKDKLGLLDLNWPDGAENKQVAQWAPPALPSVSSPISLVQHIPVERADGKQPIEQAVKTLPKFAPPTSWCAAPFPLYAK